MFILVYCSDVKTHTAVPFPMVHEKHPDWSGTLRREGIKSTAKRPRLRLGRGIDSGRMQNRTGKYGKNGFVVFHANLENEAADPYRAFRSHWMVSARHLRKAMLQANRKETLVVPMTGETYEAHLRDMIVALSFKRRS
jgi:hypothetical protein